MPLLCLENYCIQPRTWDEPHSHEDFNSFPVAYFSIQIRIHLERLVESGFIQILCGCLLLFLMWSPSLQVLAKACSCLWLASYCKFNIFQMLNIFMLSSRTCTMKDESFLVAPHLIQSARELEFWLTRNTDKAAAFMVLWRGIMQACLPRSKRERENVEHLPHC